MFLALLLSAPACTKAKLINPGTVNPKVTSIVPPAGPFVGGTKITIQGTDFTSSASVTLDGQPCTGVQVLSSTMLTCTTPAHAIGPVSVSVVNSTGKGSTVANQYTYKNNISPIAGMAITSGGGIVTGGGLMMQSAMGEPTSPMINSNASLSELNGVEGVLYEP